MFFRSILVVGALVCSVVPVVVQAELPTCAATCLSTALTTSPLCSTPTCICTSAPLALTLQTCIQTTCTLKETLISINTTNTLCNIPTKDRSHYLIITNAVFGGLALLALCIRLVVSLQQHIFGLDDASAVAAMVFAVPITVGQIVCGVLGFGGDTWTVSARNIYLILKIVYFNQLSYFLSASFSKLCFLFMFLRIFPAERTRKLVYIGIGASVVFPIAFGVPLAFGCRPISGAWTSWDRETPIEHCIDQHIFWFFAAVYNILVDVYIVVIPIPELLKLNLSTRKKGMLVAIFSTGVVTIIVSITRLWALSHYNTSTNLIYDNMLSGIFSPLELNVGIIAMCMPAFRRFVARFAPTCFGSKFNSSNRKYYEGDTIGSSGKRVSGNKGKNDTLGGSLFQSTVVRTVDGGGGLVGEEGGDQVRLVELSGSRGKVGKTEVPENAYRERSGGMSPRKW